MNNSKKLTIAAAALTGILAGASSRAMASSIPVKSNNSTKMASSLGHKATNLDDAGKHSCKGQNSCKGQGGCKTGDNGCKGKNSCKGAGGCSTTGEKPTTEPAKL